MRALASAFALAFVLLAGCVAPPGTTPTTPTPGATDDLALLAPVPDNPTKLEPASHVEFGGGTDVAFRGHHAYVASGSGMHIVDISDPMAAVEVASVPCTGSDVGVSKVGARLIVTVSSQSANDKCDKPNPKGGIRLVDVTDPANPVVLSQVPLAYGSHTHTPYGDTGLLYNSAYDLANPYAHHKSEIVDIRDPASPKVLGAVVFPQDSSSPGCHDVLAEPQYNRSVCAGITETFIWDTTDPEKPVIQGRLTNPLINIHHSAASARDGKLLLVGDEYAGAIAPACQPSPIGGPTGAIWFYAINGHQFGEMLGFLPPPEGDPGTRCTAHNFNTIDGKDLAVAGFYKGGTLLIDFSDPKAPRTLSRQTPAGGEAWGALYYRGVVLTGDLGRGLDVFVLK
jgi:hypothetical protein